MIISAKLKVNQKNLVLILQKENQAQEILEKIYKNCTTWKEISQQVSVFTKLCEIIVVNLFNHIEIPEFKTDVELFVGK